MEAVQKFEPVSTREIAPAITPMQMLQIAVEQGADLDKLSKLMDLQERWEANEARKAFVAALNAFKAEPPKLSKNKHVSYVSKKTQETTEYYHATLDQVCNVVGAALAKHNLSYRWETDQLDGGLISVTCILTHTLGHSERVTLKAGRDESGGKNNIQAVGSTVSYLQRYTLLAITGLAAADQDDDGKHDGSGDDDVSITAEQKEQLIELIRQTNSDTKKLLAFVFPKADPPITNLDEIPVARFPDTLAALQRKKAEQKDGK